MADDTRAENVVEEQSQRGPVPSPEKKLPVSGQAEEEVSSEGISKPEAELELPESASERTREQFEKLRRQNQELREELDRLARLSSSRQPQFQPTTQGGLVEQYIDPVTGEVDVNGLNKAFAEARRKADLALETIRQTEAERQEKEAYSVYPELDPNSKSLDREFFRRTRAILTDSIVNPQDYGGRPLTLKEAADLVKKPEMTAVAKGEESGIRKAISQLTPKEQASLEATGRSDRRQGTVDTTDLKRATREGDYDAVVERLKMSNL